MQLRIMRPRHDVVFMGKNSFVLWVRVVVLLVVK
jgi:hypothetical protein